METEINDLCLAEFICCIMALIIFLKLKLPKTEDVQREQRNLFFPPA